ncbi:MAG: BMC domain-containing protein [Synergistaceae bacterium]|jgi:ethanolamine utilization protein EutS|nr:BMC domain-containing protein [Synergistaceae bacterium]
MALASPQENKQRVIQEYVPGKQITLAHLIASPVPELSKKLGLVNDGGAKALGILTITPSEASIIAADIATKSACVRIAFVDRFSGALMIEGDVADVEAALKSVLDLLAGKMRFAPAVITRS